MPFPGGQQPNMRPPSGIPSSYAETVNSSVSSNNKTEDNRRQAVQTRTAHSATNDRSGAPKQQRSTTGVTTGLPIKRPMVIKRIPKKTKTREDANVTFL